ncbi:MAG: clostripain-related cysteine peptidase [bacterium]|nr:clostripain-related cysteine peptidase [bacterium]
MKRWMVILTVLLALLGLASGALAEESRLLVYMVGSDLESEGGLASADLREMMNACPESGLEVLVCAGGSQRWRSVISPDAPTLYRLTKNGMTELSSKPGSSMMDGETLAWFLNQAGEGPNAALLFWNHGGGPLVGFGRDETDPGNRLLPHEIVQALKPYVQQIGAFSWIGFDACLMGTMEMAGLLQPYAQYLIASEEVEMSCGWNYAFLSHMAEGLPVPKLAHHILSDFFDATVAACGGDPQMMPAITLACYDLALYAPLAERLDALARRMEDSVAFGSFAALAHSRSSVPSMGRFSGGLTTDLVDLRRLVQSVQAYYPAEAQAVMSALDEMVVACATNHPDNSGISVYFPYEDKAEYLSGMDEAYRSLSPAEGYRAFVDSFARQWIDGALEQTQLSPAPESEKPAIRLSAELAESFDGAYYAILQDFGENGYGFCSMGSETTLDGQLLTADIPMETAYLISGEERFPIFLRRQEADGRRVLYHASVFLVKMPPDLSDWDFQRAEMQIAVDSRTRQCTVVGAYLYEDGMQMGKRQVDLHSWDLLQTALYGYDPAYDEQGALLPFHDWTPQNIAFGMEVALDEPFRIEMAPIEPRAGNLYCQLVVRDVYGGRHGSDLILLDEKNP